jgi:D-3-phosphoglycerate dehydrogenase
MKKQELRKVVILSNTGESFPIEVQRFANDPSVELEVHEFTGEDDLITSCEYAHVVAFSDAKITRRVIEQLQCCVLLIRYGVGIDNIDLEAAKQRGIPVCNAPSYGTVDVAEHTMALIMAMSRQIPRYDSRLRNGDWTIDTDHSNFRLENKVVGLVGFGNIARKVCRRAQSFNMRVKVYDPYVDTQSYQSFDAEQVDLETLFSISDIISLHLPLNPSTEKIVGRRLLDRMKPNAILINTSRGKLVDLKALVYSLQRNLIAGVALDVFPDEPFALDDPILKCRNTILTPHVAWYSTESIVALHEEVTDDIIRVLHGKQPLNRVI